MSDQLHHTHGSFSNGPYWREQHGYRPMHRLWHWLDHRWFGPHQANPAETLKFMACQLGILQAIAERRSMDDPRWESVAARLGETLIALEDCAT